MVKSGYDFWIQHPQIFERQLTHSRPHAKKLFFNLCNMPCAFKPCALEINSDGGIKWGYVETCSRITKNKSPLQQCLWPPNLERWWLNHMVLPPIKSCDPSVTWSFENTWQIKNIFIPRVCMATKLGRMVSYLYGLLFTKSHNPWSHVFARSRWSMTTVYMATKLGRMVTYLNGLLPIKSYDPLITYSRKITWQAPLYLQDHSTYGYQTWGDGDLLYGVHKHSTYG